MAPVSYTHLDVYKRQAYFRVYSGTMNSGSYVLNATKDKKERVGRIPVSYTHLDVYKRQSVDSTCICSNGALGCTGISKIL